VLPRDPIEQQRLLEKVRREIDQKTLVRGLNGGLTASFGRKGQNVDPRKPIKALALIRQLEHHRNVFPYGMRKVVHQDPEKAQLLRRLNGILNLYVSAPQILAINGDGIWMRSRRQTPESRMEEAMISKMIDLAQSGKLHRLRTCALCARWFFAKQPNQTCCTKSCGQNLIDLDDSKREARNARRRKNYRTEDFREDIQANADPFPEEWCPQ